MGLLSGFFCRSEQLKCYGVKQWRNIAMTLAIGQRCLKPTPRSYFCDFQLILQNIKHIVRFMSSILKPQIREPDSVCQNEKQNFRNNFTPQDFVFRLHYNRRDITEWHSLGGKIHTVLPEAPLQCRKTASKSLKSTYKSLDHSDFSDILPKIGISARA